MGAGLADTLAGTAGDDLISGSAGDDLLYGGAGNDILLDGTGLDRMVGGAGADSFVLSVDAQTDRILDFDPAQDSIDLSAWAFLRNTGQLAIMTTADGAEIRFGTEVLRIVTSTGQPLSAAQIRGMGLLDLSRLLPSWFPVEAPAHTLLGGLGADTLIGQNAGDLLRGADSADFLTGKGGADFLYGDAGNDLLIGDEGNDALVGGTGLDRLFGGAGIDLLYGGTGDDRLWGDVGNDGLNGDEGNDRLDGGAGRDTLRSGAGADSFVFSGVLAGADRILDFTDNVDTLILTADLWGGARWSIAQVMSRATLNNGHVVFDFGHGNSLIIDGLPRLSALADDLVVVWG